jgi:hypothetical protein
MWYAVMVAALAGTLLPACASPPSPAPGSPSASPMAAAGSPPAPQPAASPTDDSAARYTFWGASREIDEVYARVQRPMEAAGTVSGAGGKKVVLVAVTFENDNDRARHYDAYSFTAYDAAGRRYRPTTATSRRLVSGDLQPDESVQGFLAFEVPADAAVVRVVWGPLPVFEWVNEWRWQ